MIQHDSWATGWTVRAKLWTGGLATGRGWDALFFSVKVSPVAMVAATRRRVDGKGYSVDAKGYIMDAKGCRVDVKGYSVDAKGYRVDALFFSVKVSPVAMVAATRRSCSVSSSRTTASSVCAAHPTQHPWRLSP
eukprot:9499746-Pyramimonas_sp.AAC.1